MVQGPDEHAEAWSALVDGEVDARTAGDLVARWREDDRAREAWHAYHLIGDVLRSEDLAGNGRDRGFVQRLNARLALEPTVLAPMPIRTEPPRRWAMPVGLAAGVALVVATLLVTRAGPDDAVLAQAHAPRAGAPGLALAASAAAPPRLLRDARLDRYLAAHKQYQSANALGPSTGFIRSATYDTDAR